jgi:hypothetical protein
MPLPDLACLCKEPGHNLCPLSSRVACFPVLSTCNPVLVALLQVSQPHSSLFFTLASDINGWNSLIFMWFGSSTFTLLLVL